jgi:hypothetical protein
MDMSHTSRSAEKDTASASAEQKRDVALASFAGGLSAWLGGVAFCIGFGVTAPGWVALVLTVFAATAAGVSRIVARRSGMSSVPAR